MIEKSLPITVAPIEGECLKTLLMRSASVYGVSTEQFIGHCFKTQGQGRRTLTYGTMDALTTHLDKSLVNTLSSALSISSFTLRQLTLSERFPSASSRLIACTGGSRNPETGEDAPNHQLRFGWCPLCLMEDRAEGEHHHMRPEWSLAFVTMCQTHNRLPAGLVVSDPNVYFRDVALRNASDQPNTIEVIIGTGDLRDNRFVASATLPVDVVTSAPLNVRPQRKEWRNLDFVSVTLANSSSPVVAAANPDRHRLWVKNIGPNGSSLFGSGPFVSTFPIAPGETLILEGGGKVDYFLSAFGGQDPSTYETNFSVSEEVFV